jgi:GNAT superfamily N-acetyltransferase
MTMASFRAATTDDVPLLLDLVRAYYESDGIAFEPDSVERGLRTLLANASLGGAWLIESGSDLVGYFALTYGFDLEFGGRHAILTDLFLIAPQRRQGLGSATLCFIEGLLEARGIGALELQAERDNEEALAFYRRHGFERRDRVPMSKRIGDD